ncbi:hypothetical protein HYFRA_00011914 [Hymenoscyphus fraxineus]|uniref:Uncharacterized protein n=1 Tax=Hymenoscyphus fraxineus TaxID=746836 RepID=A0A9N9PVE4_9HELO|nr:hypothetical protein HYFRA_00011914 [Hymenoscyphus fraxineus]
MADDSLIGKIHDLSDLELAALICLVTKEHCIIDTEPDALDELVDELELVAAKVFGLSHAVIDCSEHTTLDDFAHAILSVDENPTRSNSPVLARRDSRQDSYFLHAPTFQPITRSPVSEGFGDNKSIANVIIAKNLDEAPKQVQIQALELMRTKRIYTRTNVQNAPKRFLFIALLAGGQGPRLTKHLNDHMFISHFHDPEDGFPNLEERFDDGNSNSSVVKKSPSLDAGSFLWPTITAEDIERLSELSENATVTVEVLACLAPLHNLAFATPSLIALATRKIYPHRIHIVRPERERSMQWGSDVDAVAALLEGIGPEDVIEDVLGNSGAEAPL